VRTILFPLDPIHPRRVDPAWASEAEAVTRLGGTSLLVDHDAAARGDADAGVREAPRGAGELVYRGWMLRPDRYRKLHDALIARGLRPITSPAQYETAHHLPNAIAHLTNTPETRWLPMTAPGGRTDFAPIHALLAHFGSRAVVLKDYVKSRKHEWKDACFIPDASDRAAVERVVSRFLELQGDGLEGGLVFREFVELAPIGIHPKSGMPLSREIRTFWLDGRPILTSPYWEGDRSEAPDLALAEETARGFPSRFFTLDLAQKKTGGWIVVEAGDGQVSALPDGADVETFVRGLIGSG
jgi:hypothetical protein